jgi:Ca-activated chloride channel family protein
MFAIPIAWLIYTMITKKRVEQVIFSEEILKKLRSDSGGLSLRVRSFIALFSLLFIITALSRPVSSDGKIEIESKSVDIVFAIDISKSMLATDSYPNRLEFAKRKALDLIEKMPKSRIGVIAFANNSYIVSPLTFDHRAVSYLLQNLDTENISEQGTSIETLLNSANEFLKSGDEKNLLIFTDGGDGESYEKELQLANSFDFKIYTVGFGSEDGSPIPQKDGSFIKYNGDIVITALNENIKNLSTGTGGFYLHSTNSSEDMDYISSQFSKLQSVEKKKQEIPVYIEYFYYPLSVAIFLLIPLFYSLPKWKRRGRGVATALLLFLVVGFSQDLEAGMFDFYHLQQAEELYQSGKYREAIEEYKKIELSDEVNYNIGNSYYRDGNFSEAVKHYRKVSSEDRELKRKTLHNLGNSYSSMEKFPEAKKSYEDSLEFSDEQNSSKTLENLEWVKKKIEEQRKEQEDQQNQSGQDGEKNRNDQNGDGEEKSEDQSQDGENSDQEDSQKDQNSKESDSKGEQQNSAEDGKKSDQDSEEQGSQQKEQKSDADAEQQQEGAEQSDENSSKQEFIKEKLENEDNSTSGKSRITGNEAEGDDNLTNDLQDEKIFRLLQNQEIGTKMFGILPYKENQNSVKPW